MKYENILETIGNTPLVKINQLTDESMATIYAKVESFNPSGSVKDRAAIYILDAAKKMGLLKEGGTIIEPTSGNTGIGFAMIGAALGYEVILVMPETMSLERRKILKAYGAKLILTDAKLGMKGSIEVAQKLVDEKGYFMPNQFENEYNVLAHFETTAQEIIRDTKGDIDAFVAGVGTGGTLSGTGKKLKMHRQDIHVVAVEPEKSSLLSGNAAGPHKIQGIGANFIPKIYDADVVDEVMCVSDEEAFETARLLVTKEGLFAGISSGAAMSAALKLAKRLGKGKTIVVILPDGGDRYLSTDLFIGEEHA